MSQPRRWSLVESVTNVIAGYAVAVAMQYALFPLFGIECSHRAHFAIGACFTVVSLLRSYILRRIFNGIEAKRQERCTSVNCDSGCEG